MQTARVNQLLLGKDRTASRRGVALAFGLFVLAFVAVTGGTQLAFSLEYVAIGTLVLLTGLFTYYNEGVLVSLLISTAPIYAYFIELIHIGNIGPTPYPQAVINAAPWALLFGIPVGLVGGLLGLTIRRLSG